MGPSTGVRQVYYHDFTLDLLLIIHCFRLSVGGGGGVAAKTSGNDTLVEAASPAMVRSLNYRSASDQYRCYYFDHPRGVRSSCGRTPPTTATMTREKKRQSWGAGLFQKLTNLFPFDHRASNSADLDLVKRYVDTMDPKKAATSCAGLPRAPGFWRDKP